MCVHDTTPYRYSYIHAYTCTHTVYIAFTSGPREGKIAYQEVSPLSWCHTVYGWRAGQKVRMHTVYLCILYHNTCMYVHA